MKELTIGPLAKAAGVNVETIRLFKTPTQRAAKPSRPGRVSEIPRGRGKTGRFHQRRPKVGTSSKEIADLLSLGREGRSVSCAEMLELAIRKIGEIANKIMMLEAIKAALGELTEICPGSGNLALCPIWERMADTMERKEVSHMAKRKVEVFTVGGPVCTDLVNLVKATACPNCEVTIYNLGQGQGVEEAKKYGVSAVPAVVVEGKLLDCCKRAHVTKHDLEAVVLASRFKGAKLAER